MIVFQSNPNRCEADYAKFLLLSFLVLTDPRTGLNLVISILIIHFCFFREKGKPMPARAAHFFS